MEQPIQRYLQVGTLSWMSYPPARYDVVSSIRQLACDPFFDAIEICHMEDDTTRTQVKALLEQSHMTVTYAAQPQMLALGLNPNHPEETVRAAAEQTLKAAIDEAAFLGAGGFSFMAGKWTPETRDVCYWQLVKTTHALCRYAAEKGMTVDLELFDYDMDKAVLMGPAPYGAKFAAEIRCQDPNFGLLLDLSHLPTTYETPSFAVQVLKPYLTHFHFGNAVVRPGCDAFGDKHPRFGYPNSANDTAELTEYLRVLRENGFFRPDSPVLFSMEVTPRPNEDADLILTNTKRVLNRAWACL